MSDIGGRIGAASFFRERRQIVLTWFADVPIVAARIDTMLPFKKSFIAPPTGPGLSGDAPVPVFGAADCPSKPKMRTVEVEAQRGEDGCWYAVNPFTGRRVYYDPQMRNTVKFETLP